jgi:hypothetical protein
MRWWTDASPARKALYVGGGAISLGIVIGLVLRRSKQSELPQSGDGAQGELPQSGGGAQGDGGGPRSLPAPPPPDSVGHIYEVLDKAAKYEVDTGILKDLRDRLLDASMVDSRWDPYYFKIQERLDSLLPLAQRSTVVQTTALTPALRFGK